MVLMETLAALGKNCVHEHACLRFPLLWPDPTQGHHLLEIRDNLDARVTEAHCDDWLGEFLGLHNRGDVCHQTRCPAASSDASGGRGSRALAAGGLGARDGFRWGRPAVKLGQCRG
jgi:hypothetical protein